MKYLKKHQTYYELFASHRMTLQLVILTDFACAKLSSGTAAAAADNWRGVDSRAWLRNKEKALLLSRVQQKYDVITQFIASLV